jgi:hypothetical protein
MLPNVMPHSTSMAVFADGLRVDPAVLSWNPYTSHVTTKSWNKQTQFEVMGFGYSATGVIRDVQYFHKTAAQMTFDLGYDCRDIAASQLLITANGTSVAGNVANGILTVANTVPDGLLQVAILDKKTDTFNQVTTSRFGIADFTGKSLAQLYPDLANSARAPLMNNFVIEIDGARIAPEMFSQTNLNAFNRVLRIDRDAPVSDLSVRFNGSAVTLGDKLVRNVTIPASTRSFDLGQGVALQDITVTDTAGNALVVGELHPDYSVNFDNPGVIAASMYTPANASLLLAHGRLINISAMSSNLKVLVSIKGFVPSTFTEYSWTPSNAKFVKVNDVIASVNNTDMGLLEIADKGMGQIGLTTPILSVFPNAKVVTVTDFKSASQMGARTWTYHTDIQSYYPVSALPATDSAVWVTLNGKRLVNNVDYKIVRTGHPGWEEFVWDREGMDSDEYQLRGALASSKQPANATMDSLLTYGIELLISTNKDDLLVATVFENTQASYARVFELFIKDKVDRTEEYATPREITLGDRYELVTNVNTSQTQYGIRQAAGPFTRSAVKSIDINDNTWLQNEYVTIKNIVEGSTAVITGNRGANVTIAVPHAALASVVAPRIIGPASHYMPL